MNFRYKTAALRKSQFCGDAGQLTEKAY